MMDERVLVHSWNFSKHLISFTMKARRFVLLIGIISVLILGCRKNLPTTYIHPVDLSLDTTLSELSDSFFVPPQVRCLNASGEYLYYTDYVGGLVVLDKDYQVKKQLGTRGQGPGEFLGAAHFYLVGKDSIYILNEGKHSIDVFAGDEYKQTIPFPKSVRFTFNTRFFVDKGSVYHSVIAKESPVVVFNNDTSSFMCSYTPFDDSSMGRHVTKHILKGDNSFFLIGCVYPTLEQYSMDGKLLKQFDLSVIPAVSQMMQAYRDALREPESYFTVIQDTYYCNGDLYLLIGLLNDGNYSCNTVAVLNLSDAEWKYTKYFRLSGKVYDTFCVDNEKMYVHDPARSCFDIFSFK